MAGYTYTTLKQAIQDYTDNQETTFVANLDNFIRAAEERILKGAPLEAFRKNASSTLTSADQYLSKPADWLFTFALSVTIDGEKVFLLNKDTSFVQEYWPDASATGEPKYYADYDLTNFILAPTPDSAYTTELHYYYRPESIVDASGGTTWLGTNAGEALLYGALVEAYTFTKGDADMMQAYEQMFQRVLNRLSAFAQGPEGRDFYRSGSE